MNDLKFALRQMLKRPGFAAIAILTLALGIGANTSIFSVVNAVLLRPLPYPDAHQLTQLRLEGAGAPNTEISAATFVTIKGNSRTLKQVAAYSDGDMTLTGAGQATRVVVGAVTVDFFPLLGVLPELGRNFTQDEDLHNGPKAVILGHALWQNQFGAHRDVLGKTIHLDEQGYEVVGVLPAHFQHAEGFQLWIPLALNASGTAGGALAKVGEGMIAVKAIARLQPGLTVSQARTELQGLDQQLKSSSTTTPAPKSVRKEGRHTAEPQKSNDPTLGLVGLQEQMVGDKKTALYVLLGAVALVLLIACANVANLLLARAAVRRKEMALRTALGASRYQIVRQLLIESVLLALVGGALGLAMAYGGVHILEQWSLTSLPFMQRIAIDGSVLSFTLLTSILTGLVFGVVPALEGCRTDVNGILKEHGGGETPSHRQWFRQLLVASEIALALVLLIGAGLLIKSFSQLTEIHPGFQTEGVLTLQVNLTGKKSPKQRAQFVEQVLQRLKTIPGAQSVAATDTLPLTPFSRITVADIEGRPPIDFRNAKPGQVKALSRPVVTVDYFSAMGISVREGRAFILGDMHPGSAVVMVNEAFERFHFPSESAVGKRIRLGGGRGEARWQTIVGVVSDVRQTGLAGDIKHEVYSPEPQDMGEFVSFVIRSHGESSGIIALAREMVAEVEPHVALYNVMTMEQRLAQTTTSRRFNTVLLGLFAGAALLLAAVGIYGVMSYSVTQRRREMGVRMALGAQKRQVLALMIQGGMRLTLLGIFAGILGAFALTRYLSTLLFSVKATDPWTFVAAAVVLSGVALLASWMPAWRAAKVDPMVALRND